MAEKVVEVTTHMGSGWKRNITIHQFDVHVRAVMNSAGLLGQPSDDPVGFKEIAINASIDADLTDAEKNEFLDTCVIVVPSTTICCVQVWSLIKSSVNSILISIFLAS